MTDNERELLNIIRSHNAPDRAIDIAIGLMIDFLDEREALQDTSSARLQVTV